MSGMEMMLINMLKAFMPKEAAEKIAGYATDGTFDRIGAIPSELDAIKASLARIELELAGINRRQVALLNQQPERTDALSGIAIERGLDPFASARDRTTGNGASAATCGDAYNGHGGSASEVGDAGA